MGEPASQWMVLIVEVLVIMYSVMIIYQLSKIEDQIKELKLFYGNSTIRAHRNEPHRAGNESPVRNETDNKDS